METISQINWMMMMIIENKTKQNKMFEFFSVVYVVVVVKTIRRRRSIYIIFHLYRIYKIFFFFWTREFRFCLSWILFHIFFNNKFFFFYLVITLSMWNIFGCCSLLYPIHSRRFYSSLLNLEIFCRSTTTTRKELASSKWIFSYLPKKNVK